MATPSVLTFDAEGRAVDFEVWVDDLQLFLQCDRADGLSLFDLTSGASPAPPATADSTVRSQWATRDAAARLAVRRHLPTTERAHFSQYRSAQTLYDAVVTRYSSPPTAALSRLILPYLFPDLAAFPTVADLITHLRTSDTRYRAALTAKDHFLSVCPTTLTVDLLEQRLLAAETSIVAVGASRGDPRTPVFEGCSPSPLLPSVASVATADLGGFESVVVVAVEGVGVVVGVVAGVEVSAAVVEAKEAVAVAEGAEVAEAAELAEAAEVTEAAEAAVELVAALRRGVAPVAVSASSSSAVVRPRHPSSFVSGTLGVSEFPDATEIPRWGDLSREGVAIFDLDYDAILAAMYAVSTSDEGDCYLYLPPDPGGEAAALGVSASAAPGAGESALSGTASAQVFHTFNLDSGASRSFFRDHTTLTPLSRPVAVSLADPSGGPVLVSFSTVLPCPAAPSGALSSLDTLRTTLTALGFVPSIADPSLFLRTDTSLPPFYILVYIDDLVFATADTAGLAHVKSELQKRHTCTDLGELRSYLGLQITRDRAQRTITPTQSHMVQQVLQRFDFTYSSPQATPLSTRHSLSALPSDESVESSGPYPELVGCLIYLMTCTRADLAYPLSILARYVAPGRHRPEHMAAAKRVLRYLCSASGLGLVLGGRRPVVLIGHADASWADDQATQRSSQGYTFSLGSGSVLWRSTRSSSVLGSSCEAEIYAGAMAAQEFRWLTYLLTDLGEPPRSPPVLYVDNKAMLALCREHRLEHRTKHIALRYFLARELQQRGQLRLAYVASEANTADIFTKALPPGDHQRFCTMLACFALLDWSCDLLFPTCTHLLSSSIIPCYFHNVTTWFEGELQKDLTLTVSSTVTQYLGLNIQEEEGAIYLNAAKYADTFAKRFALTPTTISTPYRYTAGNNEAESAPLKLAGIRNYQRKLGCLLFAAVTCRPDLSCSTSQLATYLKRPEAEHMAELDHALHYLVSTPTIGLIYYKSKTTMPKLIGYVDSDHAGDPDNRRSRTGYIYRLEPIEPISWQSSKQELIALSSAEVEYIALCPATKEGLYLRELLEEAKLAQLPSFSMFCDNQSAIRIANKNGFANRTKHIALRYFFVKDEIEKGRLELSYCPTSEMAVDYLTKKLGKSKFEYCMLLTGQSHVTNSDTPEAKGGVGNS
ncbi:unnamed protein product [Closterium sp. NIES-53]